MKRRFNEAARLAPNLIGTLAMAVGLVTFAPPTAAQSLRCTNGLVSVGDSTESVLKQCGEPATRRTRCVADPAQYQPGQVTACVDVEEWTYKPGYGQFVTTLRFEDGALAKIIYGDRM